MSDAAWAALSAILSALAATLGVIAVARIQATKTDVGAAKDQAARANTAAVAANSAAIEARELARPTGNGYADETRAALAQTSQALAEIRSSQVRIEGKNDAAIGRIERKVDGLQRDVLHHLQDHSRSDLERREHPRERP